MSRRSALAPTALRSISVVVSVAVLVLGGVVVGQRLLRGADARAPEAPLGPVSLRFGTFLGGLEWDEANDVEVDDAGNRYMTGFSTSRDFPDARAEGPGGIVDAFVVKISAEGALVWSVVLGGTDHDAAYAQALDADGNVYVTGRTGSTDFPTANPLQPELAGSACAVGAPAKPCHDALVTKLDPDGGLVYSTYLGGTLNEEGLGIAVDGNGSAYVSGNTDSLDLPTRSAFQEQLGSPPCPGDLHCELDVFVSKLTPDGGDLEYSTYLGGEAGDTNAGIAVADDRTAFVAGTTRSTTFPVVGGVQGEINGIACGPPPGNAVSGRVRHQAVGRRLGRGVQHPPRRHRA